MRVRVWRPTNRHDWRLAAKRRARGAVKRHEPDSAASSIRRQFAELAHPWQVQKGPAQRQGRVDKGGHATGEVIVRRTATAVDRGRALSDASSTPELASSPAGPPVG